MKNIIILILTFTFSFTFSQVNVSSTKQFFGSTTGIKSNGPGTSISYFTRIYQSKFSVVKSKYILKGSYHVFPTWKNNGILRMDNKTYRINGVNLNVKTDNLEAKIPGDSIFIFNFSKAEYAKINNRTFKSLFFFKENKNKVVEVIYEGSQFKLYKKYEVAIELGRVDPLMVKKKVNKYYLNSKYYLKTDNGFKEITLKKKNILPLFKDKSSDVYKYIKTNKLSYKKDRDLKKIFKYYKSLIKKETQSTI